MKSSVASEEKYSNFSGLYHWRHSNANLDPATYTNFQNSNVSYMHYAGKPNWPILNWQNDSSREHMFDVLSYWIDKDVDGFHLIGLDYLARTPTGKNPNWSSILDIVRDIRNHVDTYSRESTIAKNKKIILFVNKKEAKDYEKEELLASGMDSVMNYDLGTICVSGENCACKGKIGECAWEFISDALLFHSDKEETSPLWEFGNPTLPRLASRIRSRSQAELLTLVQLMLPGVNSFYYGEEIGMRDLVNDTLTPPQQGAMQWDGSKNAGFSTADRPQVNVHGKHQNINWERLDEEKRSQLKMFRTLAKLRATDETMISGKTFIGKLTDEHGFTLTRFLYNNTESHGDLYIAAVNFGPSSVNLTLTGTPTLSQHDLSRPEIVTTSSNVEESYSLPDVSSETITLKPETGVVIKLKSKV